MFLFFSLADGAQAEPTAGTGWQSFTNIYPTNLQLGGTGTIQIQLLNTGAKPSSGAITVTDVLPEGLEATKVGALPAGVEGRPDVGDLPQSPEEEAKDRIIDMGKVRKARKRWGGVELSRHDGRHLYEQPGVSSADPPRRGRQY